MASLNSATNVNDYDEFSEKSPVMARKTYVPNRVNYCRSYETVVRWARAYYLNTPKRPKNALGEASAVHYEKVSTIFSHQHIYLCRVNYMYLSG